MMSPRKHKWRKHQKGRVKGLATRGYNPLKTVALKALSPKRVTARQLEAGRVVINRTLKRAGMLSIRVFPDLVVTKKPAEVRMGSGKGSPDHWAARVHPGRILYELDATSGTNKEALKEALRKAGCKMPLKYKVIDCEDVPAVHCTKAHETTAKEGAVYITG